MPILWYLIDILVPQVLTSNILSLSLLKNVLFCYCQFSKDIDEGGTLAHMTLLRVFSGSWSTLLSLPCFVLAKSLMTPCLDITFCKWHLICKHTKRYCDLTITAIPRFILHFWTCNGNNATSAYGWISPFITVKTTVTHVQKELYHIIMSAITFRHLPVRGCLAF